MVEVMGHRARHLFEDTHGVARAEDEGKASRSMRQGRFQMVNGEGSSSRKDTGGGVVSLGGEVKKGDKAKTYIR